MHEAAAHFRRHDRVLAAAAARVGIQERPRSAGGFAGLARTIIGQQVSVAAAAAIERRAAALIGEWQPQRWLACSLEAQRAAGLSRAKAAAISDLAERCLDGRLQFGVLAAATDDEAVALLCAVRGIGRWTAENYLMHAEGRPDIFPAADLGLRDAVRLLYGLPELPSEAALRRQAQGWSPYRTYAAWLLWDTRRATAIRATEGAATGNP
jgi:DNA-3-methyladenine glycosylase II